jgi:NADPH:quinone reductase-like Zn-dependent oxidoreductase
MTKYTDNQNLQIPDKLSYSQAASLPLALATAAIGLYAERPSGAGLNPSFAIDSSINYYGQAALVIGGATSVGQYGEFSKTFYQMHTCF